MNPDRPHPGDPSPESFLAEQQACIQDIRTRKHELGVRFGVQEWSRIEY